MTNKNRINVLRNFIAEVEEDIFELTNLVTVLKSLLPKEEEFKKTTDKEWKKKVNIVEKERRGQKRTSKVKVIGLPNRSMDDGISSHYPFVPPIPPNAS